MSLLVFRILKWTLISGLALAALLAILFSLFVLNPLEGRLSSLEAVVPDSVNLFAAKEVAGEEATGFVRTPFWQRLTRTRAYQIWVRSPEWRQTGAAKGLENALAELNVVEDDYRVDPLAEVAGREIGLGLQFHPDGPPDFLLFLRLSFKARALVAMLENSTLRSWMNMTVDAVPDSPVLDLRLPPGTEPAHLYLLRLKDVLVVGSQVKLVDQVHRLARGQGRSFADRVGRLPGGAGTPVSFRLSPDPGAFSARWSRLLIPPEQDALSRTFLEALDPRGLLELGGRFHLTRSPHLEIDADFQDGSFSPFQEVLFRTPAPDIRQAMEPFVNLAPRELMLFLYAQTAPRDTARFMEDTLDPETRKLVEDTLAPTPLKNLTTLLDRWLGDLKPGFALYLNRQEFETTPTHPPYPGATLVFRLRDPSLWKNIHFDLLDHLKQELTITDAKLDQPRVDVEIMTYTFRANPYGRVVNPVFARFGDLIAFSTCVPFVRRMADIYLGEGRYGLARSGEIDSLFDGPHALAEDASVFGFLDVRRTLRWVDDYAPTWARAASLRQQLDNAVNKRRALEFQARGLRHLKTPKDQEAWVDDQMERWYRRLDQELNRRVNEVVGPMVKHLGVLHTVGWTLGPARRDPAADGSGSDPDRSDATRPGLRLRASLHFDP